jgi:hypothetical protein
VDCRRQCWWICEADSPVGLFRAGRHLRRRESRLSAGGSEGAWVLGSAGTAVPVSPRRLVDLSNAGRREVVWLCRASDRVVMSVAVTIVVVVWFLPSKWMSSRHSDIFHLQVSGSDVRAASMVPSEVTSGRSTQEASCTSPPDLLRPPPCPLILIQFDILPSSCRWTVGYDTCEMTPRTAPPLIRVNIR